MKVEVEIRGGSSKGWNGLSLRRKLNDDLVDLEGLNYLAWTREAAVPGGPALASSTRSPLPACFFSPWGNRWKDGSLSLDSIVSFFVQDNNENAS